MTEKDKSEKKTQSAFVGLLMAVIMLLAVFTVAIPASVAQPPSPPNPPVDVTETSSLRVYGQDDEGPLNYSGNRSQFIYPDWGDPFDPTFLAKDSLTFSPAIILWNGQNAPMSAGSININEKKFLRMWYEPAHKYTKTYCRPTIEVESTYMLIDRQDLEPIGGPANVTFFMFPITEIEGQTGLGAFENVNGTADRDNVVRLAGVENNTPLDGLNKTTNGTIRIEKTYMLNAGDEIQFLDFKLQFKYIVAKNGKHYAKVLMKYAGNYEDDTATTTVLGQYDDGYLDDPHRITWFKRHIERYSEPSHDYYTEGVRTWYAIFEDEVIGDGVEITVGKEISAGDTFYVNAVRYDVPAIEVVDGDGDSTNGAEWFKFITLRTPLPKGDGQEVPDDGKISSQWIFTLPPSTVIPLNPPFNWQAWKMVDDINVVLWAPLKHQDQWPNGNPNGVSGKEYFPYAEQYLTQQDPNHDWLYYFRAVPVDTDNDGKFPSDWQIWDQYGPYYRENLTSAQLKAWIAYDVNERILDVNKPLQVVYLDEMKEPRYSTDLLEILNETLYINEKAPYENWTKFDIQTLPDQYTEFVLPELPDVVTPLITKPGDYLLTTSFLAPNSVNKSTLNRSSAMPRVAFAYDVDYENGVGDGLDLYVNMWGSSSSIRIYGDDNKGPVTNYLSKGKAAVYPHWQCVFDPTSLQKDSITFNPVFWAWDGTYYPMSAQSHDIDVKTFLRLWYEPKHNYSKDQYVRPTIEVETTYMLIDKQTKLPTKGSANDTFFIFPIAEDESTETPGLELFENPNSEPDRLNVVSLADVSGTVPDPYNKTTNGTIWLQKTYKLDKGDKVQFLDHKLTFIGIVVHNNSYYAKVKVDYAGNREDDTGTALVLATFDGGATYDPDPHRITWFKRHSETYRDSKHDPDYTTWYALLENYDPNYDWAEITVGKELSAGDVFYVDGVRYDIPAIEVIDNTGNKACEKFKYITLRTPYPKCFATGVSPVPDDGIISSQWIECIRPYAPIPLLPPFNMDHKLVDDIDVVLWKPLKHSELWPMGDSSGVPGKEWFPLAERYLTMQYPPADWLYYFRAVPIDTDNDMNPRMPTDWEIWDQLGGPFYPGKDFPIDWEVGVCGQNMMPPVNYTIFDKDHWIALDLNERIIPDPYAPLEITYVDEFYEPRYSTNLLEVLWEYKDSTNSPTYRTENWTKYDIQTLPDQYTEFVLPKDDVHAGQRLMNDYLITTSFLAPNALGDLFDHKYPSDRRFAFVFDAFDAMKKTGLYVNELVIEPPPPENKAPVLVIDVDPTVVDALETVTVDTAGTNDDQYPIQIDVDWDDDGTVETAWMADVASAPKFTHEYTKSGTYTVTVTATDKYGADDSKTAPVTVNNDGAVLYFQYGWNAISAPVQDSRSMTDLFVSTVPGFYGAYSWDNAEQKWVPEDPSQPLDPKKGYLIWATDPATVELTGLAANFDTSWIVGLGWNLVGAGAEPYTLTTTYAYWYDNAAGTYIPGRTMEPGKGYFIWA